GDGGARPGLRPHRSSLAARPGAALGGRPLPHRGGDVPRPAARRLPTRTGAPGRLHPHAQPLHEPRRAADRGRPSAPRRLRLPPPLQGRDGPHVPDERRRRPRALLRRHHGRRDGPGAGGAAPPAGRPLTRGSPIDISPVADGENGHRVAYVVDFVDYAEITDANPPAVATAQLPAAARSRLFAESPDSLDESSVGVGRGMGQLLLSSTQNREAIAHPRLFSISATACSKGMASSPL